MRTKLFAAMLLNLVVLPVTGAELWQPAGTDGTVGFTAVQEGAKFQGRFRRFSASFELDPADPTTGHFEATIDMGSVDTLYDERDQVLRDSDWFDVAHWPQARFETETIRRGDDGYLADGLLTIRDKTQPVTLSFHLQPLPDGQLEFRGSAQLQRLDFGVGQGQWTSTDSVGNEVSVNVELVLQSALP